jgi:pyruvate kinase
MGPACWDVDMLVKMMDAGMNVARLDFAHGDHKQHAASIDNLKEALMQRPGKSCGIMLDTKGFEIRTGYCKGKDPIEIVADQTLKLVTDDKIEGDSTRIGVSFKKLPQSVKVGSTINIGDGLLTAEVCEIGEDFINVTCKNACKLGERKLVRLSSATLDVPALTEKDEEDIIEFGIK